MPSPTFLLQNIYSDHAGAPPSMHAKLLAWVACPLVLHAAASCIPCNAMRQRCRPVVHRQAPALGVPSPLSRSRSRAVQARPSTTSTCTA